MHSLYWVGKYESDISNCKIFRGSITYYGRNTGNNWAFCSNNIRINSKRTNEYINFIIGVMKNRISEEGDCNFLFYNQSLAYEIIALYPQCKNHIIGINTQPIIDTLNNKLYNRLWLSDIIDIVPVKTFSKSECNYLNLKSIFPAHSCFVIQKNISSGGKGTYLLTKDSENDVLGELKDGELYIVSPYIEKSYSVNIHVCITAEHIICFPFSLQITKLFKNKLLFCGSDYIAASNIAPEIQMQLRRKVTKIGEMLRLFGYTGILGIDLLITQSSIYFVEINPRFQGSSFALCKSLLENGLPSLYEIHLNAFSNQISCELIKKIDDLQVNYSILIYNYFEPNDNIDDLYMRMKGKRDLFEVYDDGYNPTIPIDYNAYVYRVLIKRNISYINPDNRLNFVENLMSYSHLDFPIKNAEEIITLKIALLTQGITISKNAYNYISEKSTIKEATFNAIDISIFDGLKINCPINIPFCDLSPFHIEYDPLNNLQLYFKHSYISKVIVDTNENILDRKTLSGVPYASIGFKTNDRVRIRHTAVCHFKELNQSCSFCESKHVKQYDFLDADIFEVIDAYEKEVNFRHYLIGGASEKNELEPDRIKKIIQYIRMKSNKPIYLMSLPPKDISHIYDYYQLGLNEVAFNIEIYDRKIACQLMPGKGRIPLTQYMNALEESTKYFGKTGNVRSMLIVGLEQENSLMRGVRDLCAIGVSPMLSIFRPMPLTTMNHIIPPTVENIKCIYNKAAEICAQYNLALGPSCAQCQNNTLSLSEHYLAIQ